MAVIFALTLVSCSGQEDQDEGDDNNETPVLHESYVTALASPALSATMTSNITSSLGRLEASYSATYNNGEVNVSYTRSTFGTIDENTSADDLISTVTDTAVIRADGSSDGKIGALASALLRRELNLSGVSEYTDKDGSLSFTVTSENSGAVFGNICEYDVAVTITLNDGRIDKISLSYESESGTVMAECSYKY